MNYMRQVSKKKLVKWIEQHQKPFQQPESEGVVSYALIVSELFDALDKGELDMVKDYRIHGEEKQK